MEAEKEDIMVKNRSLAEFNLGKEPELEEAKSHIQALSEEGSQLCASVQAKLEEISKFVNIHFKLIFWNITIILFT